MCLDGGGGQTITTPPHHGGPRAFCWCLEPLSNKCLLHSMALASMEIFPVSELLHED